jgi:glucose-1-phosphate thymidylyltransferase
MCYYSLSTLLLAGIRDILIISTPHDISLYQQLLGDGSQWGVNFSYTVQSSPDGLPQAYILGKDFIGNSNTCLVLGDNIFYGHGFTGNLQKASQNTTGATVFAYRVTDPQRFGVVEFDDQNKVLSIEEKPSNPKSNWAITGLYFCDNDAVRYAQELKPSARKELEIVDLLKKYSSNNSLMVEKLGRGIAWLDTGTHDSLLQASNYIQTIQQRQGTSVACPEEIAFHQKWIGEAELELAISANKNSSYGEYLKKILQEAQSKT